MNPRLIYASISGYGQTGPARDKGGFDLIAQGVSGIMSVTGEPGGPPAKAGVPLTDLGAGLFALVGILAAIESRHRTGAGQQIDTSLVDAGVALSVWEATEYFSGVGVPAPLGSAHRMLAPYQAVRCADGYITLGAGTDRLFLRMCEVLGHPDGRACRTTPTMRAESRTTRQLASLIESITSLAPAAHWLEAVRAKPAFRAVRSTITRRCSQRSAGARARNGGRDRASDARVSAGARVADQDERHASKRGAACAAPR